MSRAAVNRTILAVVGLLLAAAGLLTLAGGLELYGRLGVDLPAGWPLASPDRPVLSAASRTRWVDEDWWWPVAIAVPAVLVAGSLVWLFAQLRRSGPAGVHLSTPAHSGFVLRVRSGAVEEAVRTESAALPGVARAAVHLDGGPGQPLLRTALRLEEGAGTGDLLDRYVAGPLAHARASLGLPGLRSELRLRVAPHRPAGRDHPRVL
ncbi:alkaline shock response membrane anchor protein AmaP [Kitasatospora camelliae]|uniref:Alkaline shock response membrane anchor protein AmaP n=1 Tax=Kitasatospora camelliae TaxID=3156397 RepID=A0AAU8K3Q6_9ACTN